MSLENSAASKAQALARAYVGTPFVHQGRHRGRGIDCIGLVINVMHEMHISDYDRRDYGRLPFRGELEAALNKLFVRVRRPPAPGDILLFRIGRLRQHVGIATDYGMIHAPSGKRVVEHGLSGKWLQRLAGVYQWQP